MTEKADPVVAAVTDDLLARWLESIVDDETTIAVADRSAPLPTSYSQRGMWMTQQIAGEGATSYAVRHAYRLWGPLDVHALSRALDDLVARHEPLRTAFRIVADELRQIVCGPYRFHLEAEPVDARESDAAVRRAIAEAMSKPMDLAAGCLMRARLFELAQDEHVLLLIVHHLANDAWSMTVLHEDLGELYECHRAGRQPALEPLDVQFADFAQWQLARQTPDTADADALFWRDYLAGAPQVLRLPTDRPRPAVQSFRGGWLDFVIGEQIAASMADLAREENATRYLAMLTAFQVVLAHWAGCDDLLLGSSISTRPLPAIERMVGPFTNLLAIRARVDPSLTFREALSRTKQSVLATRDHDTIPFERLLALLAVRHSPAYNPLVQVSMSSHEGLIAPLRLSALNVEYLPTEDVDVQRDLTLWITGPHGATGTVAYAADLFDRSTIQRLVDDYLRVLAHVSARPDEPVGAVRLAAAPQTTVHIEPSSSTREPAPDSPSAVLAPFVTAACADVLGRAVLVEDDFFTVGGESLTAMRVCNRLSRELDFRVAVRALYEHPRLDDFAAYLHDQVARRLASRVPVVSNVDSAALIASSDRTVPTRRLEHVVTDGSASVAIDSIDSAAPDLCLHALVERQAARGPHRIAVVFNDQCLTYADLDSEANQLARYLHAIGVEPGDHVGVHVAHSDGLIVALLAILKAGAAIVPLEQGLPPAWLRALVRDADIRTILTDHQDSRHVFAGTPARRVDLADARSAAGNLDSTALRDTVTPEQPAYVLYTSGSTGAPKGVVIPHRGICNRLRWQAETVGLGVADAGLCKTSISFDVFLGEVFLPLVSGARLVVAPAHAHRDVAALLDLIEAHRVTFAHFVASLLDVFLDQADVPRRAASLTHLWCGGEALTPRLYEAFRAVSDATVYHGYGPTEASIGVTCRIYHAAERSPKITLGEPITNVRIHLLDERAEPVPDGQPGELCIEGVALATGYLGDLGLTAQRFVPNAFSATPGSRLYRTGDLARRAANGELEFLGRIDGQLKINGRRIEPGGIESVLAEHPGIARCAVVSRHGPSGHAALTAFCVPATQPPPRPSDLITWLGDRLPDHEVPREYTFVAVLPLTVSGKLDRKALTGLGPVTPAGADPRLSTGDSVLAAVHAAWHEVLGVPSTASADFFVLGGNSLTAAKVCSRMSSWTGVRVPVRALFDHRTAATFAAEVERLVHAHGRNGTMDEQRAMRFQVLVNGEEQYGLHPDGLPAPDGWHATGVVGSQEDGPSPGKVDTHWYQSCGKRECS